ncbi:hypothetical protein [Ectopseudomonas oleovorans]|jgi:hypothetical protein|uniref:hypothetical protein n=1 Tax=Ectopseudomonas oleovorans TaxID=301 RepID=UPI0009421AE6|nr:hypothetical protein [Pseudomonas oleovorans]
MAEERLRVILNQSGDNGIQPATPKIDATSLSEWAVCARALQAIEAAEWVNVIAHTRASKNQRLRFSAHARKNQQVSQMVVSLPQ